MFNMKIIQKTLETMDNFKSNHNICQIYEQKGKEKYDEGHGRSLNGLKYEFQ